MNEIKLIIFDSDGTLYSLNDVVSMNFQMQIDFYSAYTGKDRNQAMKDFEANNIYPIMTDKSRSATEFFVRLGIPSAIWNAYREEHFDVSLIKRENSVKQGIMEKFAEICPLILLSSNSKNNIHRILNHIKISPELFIKIIGNDNKCSITPFTKSQEMRNIALLYKIPFRNMISIGDRYRTDVETMVSLGGMGIVVKGPNDLSAIYNALNTGIFDGINIHISQSR